jgi:ABC-type transport system involved in cytochrome c biogenesis permease component
LPLLALWFSGIHRDLFKYLFIPSPGYASFMAFDSTSRSTPAQYNFFTASVVCIHAMSWILLFASSLIVPRTWQDKAMSSDALRRRQRIRFGYSSPGQRHVFRRRLLDLNPMYWLSARDRLKEFGVLAFLGLGAIIWTLGLLLKPQHWRNEEAYVLTAIIAHTVLKMWAGTEACRRFGADRQSGALELLLSTPLSVKEIVRGQLMALERQFLLPICAVLLADFVFLLSQRHDSTWVTVWIAGMIMFIADMGTLSWLGMWRGLNSRRPNRAGASALARVLVLPWGIWLLLMTLWVISARHGVATEKWAIYSWLAIGLGFDALFWITSRRRLLAEFRTVATTRFETRAKG